MKVSYQKQVGRVLLVFPPPSPQKKVHCIACTSNNHILSCESIELSTFIHSNTTTLETGIQHHQKKKTITEEIKYQRTLSLLTEGDGMVRH